MMEQIMNFFISNANAADVGSLLGGGGQQGGGMSFVLMFVVFFLFAYFAIWRPQSRRAKEQANMMSALALGDEVVTVGGVVGKITKMTDLYVKLSIANNAEILMQKSAIATVLPKGTIKSIE